MIKSKILSIAILTMLFLFASGSLLAQVPDWSEPPPRPPVALRDVSGIVRDPAGQAVIGATILLQSQQDTLRVATNQGGIFRFKNVKEATFVLIVEGIGYEKSILRIRSSIRPVIIRCGKTPPWTNC